MSDESSQPMEPSRLNTLQAQFKNLKKSVSNYSDAIKLLRVARSDALKDAKGTQTPFIIDLEKCEEESNKSIETMKSVLDYFDEQVKKEKGVNVSQESSIRSDDTKIKWNFVMIQWVVIVLILIIVWRKFGG
jgi:hypothetical protein